jgi:hypothetical protein
MGLGNMALKVRRHSVRWQHRLALNAINHVIARVIHEQHARLIMFKALIVFVGWWARGGTR